MSVQELESDIHQQAERTGPDVSTSAGKTLAVLNAFVDGSAALGVSEIARRSQVSKSSAQRLLAVLESHGFVVRTGSRWRLGEHVFRLGNNVSPCRPHRLRDRAFPYMQELLFATRGVVQLAVPHGTQVLYLDKLYGFKAPASPSQVGGCMPMHCTAVGKVMLAYSSPDLFRRVVSEGLMPSTPRTITDEAALGREIENVRDVGYAMELQESATHVACVAVPVFERGVLAGALSVSTDPRQVHPRHHLTELVAAGRRLSTPAGQLVRGRAG